MDTGTLKQDKKREKTENVEIQHGAADCHVSDLHAMLPTRRLFPYSEEKDEKKYDLGHIRADPN